MEGTGTTRCDVIVVGGGIVGLATARQLLDTNPRLRLVLLEKEVAVGLHQSSHNSGVLHAGLYYAPGSLKARLCRRGKGLMERFAAERGIPVNRVGKLVVATEEAELGRFSALAERARRNGVPGLRVIDAAGLREIEPHSAGLRALHSPETAVIDFGAVCRALADDLRLRGVDVRTSSAVQAMEERGDRVRVTAADRFEARVVVVCAGLQADRLAAKTGHLHGVRIVPFRGSWYLLRPEAARLVRGNIYPVPDPRFPFLGVHFTPRLDGSVLVGPNATLAWAREAYDRRAFKPKDAASVLAFPGTWRLARRYFRTGVAELYRNRVRRAALRELRRYVPEVGLEDLMPGPSGVRAQAVRADGTMVDDFLIEGSARLLHVLNAPSPGATSSLAIGEVLASEVAARLT